MNETDIKARIAEAVSFFWKTRQGQIVKQSTDGRKDQGARGAVTGGAQMNGFIELLSEVIQSCGIKLEYIYRHQKMELPGFFRPTKEWDLLVVKDDQLILAFETKSQVGPSFGNNFNNRTEEAMGSALDLWTAYRKGAFNQGAQPWLGYLMLLEDCVKSQTPVKVQEPHFPVFPEFKSASYARRYELFCRKLVRERHYSSAAFLTSPKPTGRKVAYSEPAADLTITAFIRSISAHAAAYA